MARKFITADYEATLDLEISLREVLPPEHLARFLVEVIAELDLRRIYRRYGRTGAPPYAPEMLLGLLFYGYATGVSAAGPKSLVLACGLTYQTGSKYLTRFGITPYGG